ncbi:MAG: response regulator transcription factor [Bacteroidota bacterium]|nr:response regulator transcription factor [Flavisolibacter sp.]MBD0368831.1 response regulator transcription factor [Flavisolibacter sp.]MBD0376818.1 response regulator transcription factor [Flavisolibacter sp.]MDQ3846330.1 response regulator transcription factor [Bacteroidota bacterium]
MNKEIKVALVDDHVMLRRGLADMIEEKFGYRVLFQYNNGKELVDKLDKSNLPDVILMDINMRHMDGFEATLWLKKNYASVQVLALSMYDDEKAIIRMIRNGARGYILKENEPEELKRAIDDIVTRGFHYSERVTGKVVHSIQLDSVTELNGRHIEFLKLVCTEMTYKEIAEQMNVSPRTVDGYRDELFEKLGVKSRVGLVLFAIKNKIVHLT